MKEHPIADLLSTTIERVKELADSETVVGKPIVISDSITIIPVSKLSLGFASGGSDFPSKSPREIFGGGGGAGITVTPKAFLIIENGSVRMIQLASDGETIDRLCNLIPDAVNQVSALFKKEKTEE
ncbi:MAG: sporulation protein YtfJ [Oscillospiraceae bacterium]|nr:sporulation protein YtfJ [Oscillospiraceae bacterium]